MTNWCKIYVVINNGCVSTDMQILDNKTEDIRVFLEVNIENYHWLSFTFLNIPGPLYTLL